MITFYLNHLLRAIPPMRDTLLSQTSIRQLLLLSSLFFVGTSDTLAQCSSCVGNTTVRITAIEWLEDSEISANEYTTIINGACFTYNGDPSTHIYSHDAFVGPSSLGSTNVGVSSWEDDSDEAFGCGSRCEFNGCGFFGDDDDGQVGGSFNVDLTQPSWGNSVTFGGGEGAVRISYDVICATASPILLDLQTDYPDYCGEFLYVSASINEPLLNEWATNNGLVELVYDPVPNSFPQSPYNGGMVVLGAFDFANVVGGGFALESDDFNAPAHSGGNCEVEHYTIYARYNTAIAASLGLSGCLPWVSTQITAWPNPQTLINNGVITAADIEVTYSGCTAFFALPPGCDLQIFPTEVNLAPGQTTVGLTLSILSSNADDYCVGATLTVSVEEALVASMGTCACSGGTCATPLNITNGSGDYSFVAINGTMVGTGFELFDGEYSGFVQVTDNITGCQQLIPIYCDAAAALAQAEARDILGLNALYCVGDPTTTLYDERLFYTPPAVFPLACPDGSPFNETYEWSISNDGGTTFAPANGTNGLEVPVPTSGTALFQPTDLAAGQYVIRYCVNYSSCDFCLPAGLGGNCLACVEQVTYVYPSFDPTFTLPPLVCGTPTVPFALALDNEAAILAEIATLANIFDPANEIDEEDEFIRWSGNGVTDDANGPGGVLAVSTPGVYTVMVEVGAPNCVRSHAQTITVVEEVNALIDTDISLCTNNSRQFDLQQLFLATTTPNGTWSFVGAPPAGVSINGDVLSYDPAALAATQTFTVRYTVGDVGGTAAPADGDCYGESDAVITLVLYPSSRNFDLPDVVCAGAANLVLADYVQPNTGTLGIFTGGGSIGGSPLMVGDGTTAAEIDLANTPPGIYYVTYTETNGVTPNTCENIIIETITVELCSCPEFTDIELTTHSLCEDASNSTTATVFMDAVFSGAQVNFGATLASAPIANPYDVPPAINLGSDGALIVSATGQATLTFDNTILGAAPTCDPMQYTIYAYLEDPSAVAGLGACEPFVLTSLLVYPNPADAVVSTSTNECITIFSTSCPEFTVTPAIYVASPGDAAMGIFPVTVNGGIGNPCTDATVLSSIPACNQNCPDIHDLQANQIAVCGDGSSNTNIDLSVYTSPELLGTDITFGYATQLVNNPNNLPATLTILDIDPVILNPSGQYIARVNGVALPNNTTCNPINYIVYAFVTNAAANGAGLTADCRPVASTSITVYPDPANITITPVLNTDGQSCTYFLFPNECPGFFVYPQYYTANPGDPLTTITVIVTNTGDSPCSSINFIDVDIPACDACEIGFDLPDTYCAGDGILDLAQYTAFTAGSWAVVSGAGSVAGSNYDPIGVSGSSLVHLTFTPDPGAQCGVTVEHQYMTVYEGVDATLTGVPANLCIDNLPLDLSTLYGPTTTVGGTWTIIGPDGANPIPLSSTNFDPIASGWYSLIYTVTNGVCTASDNFQVYVHPSLDATINDVTICESPSGTVNLSAMMNPNTIAGGGNDGTTLGGVWTAVGTNVTIVGINNGVLSYELPSGSLGPYTIDVTYTLTGLISSAPAPCDEAIGTATISISGATETGFDLPSTWCEDAGDINLADFTAVGGGTWYLFSENGVNVVPPTDLAGTVAVGGLTYVGGQSVLQIRYQPGSGGCGVPMTEFITISEGVDATLTGVPANLCIDNLPLDLSTLYGPTTTVGGTWTIIGPDGANPFPLGSTNFDPIASGWYSLIYTVTNGVCTASDNFQVYVHPSLDATINDVTICESPSGTVNLSAMMNPNTIAGGGNDGTTLGGVWSYEALGSNIPAANVTINNDVLTYTIPPSTTPPYTIVVSYTLTGAIGAPAPCDEDSDIAVITITGATETGFDLPDVWCGTLGDIPLNPYTTVGGGVWTVVMVSGDSSDPLLPYSVSGSNAIIEINDIAAIDEWASNTGADSALVAITYQPAAGGCGMPITEIVEIHEDVDPSWTNPTPICAADLPLNLDDLVTGTTGGTFSGAGVYLDDNGTPADPSDDFWAWDPIAAGLIVPNSYLITYTVGFGTCQESETHEVEIYPTVADVLNSPVEVCESPSGTVNLEAFLTPNLPDNGTWTIVSHNLTIAPTISGNVLSYLISPADVSPYVINISYDLFGVDMFLEGTPCNTNDLLGQIIIHGASEVGFDLPDTWCVNDGVIDLTAYTATYSPTTGGVWSLLTDPETSIGTTYTPANGDGLVGILYTPGPGGCGMPHVEFINIVDDADPFWVNPSPLCQADLPWGLEVLTPGGTWSGAGVNEFGMFGVYPQAYVMDFGSGTILQSSGNNLYQYEEDGMYATVVTPPAFSATNRFRFLQSGSQTDIEFGEEGALQPTQTNVSVRFDYGGEPFQLTYLQLDATGLSGGCVINAYDAANTLLGTVTVPENAAGGGVITFPNTFYGIDHFIITNTVSTTSTTRTRIEEIGFNDLSNVVAPGFYPVTYTVGEFPCEESLTQIIEVVPTRSTDIRDITVCQSPSGTVDLTAMQINNVTTLNGEFTIVSHNLAIDPVIDNNTLTYQISFTDVPPYQITIQYALDPILNVFNPGPCNPAPETAILTISNTMETGFDVPDSWCVQEGAIYLPNYTQIGGGTYSLIDNPATPFDESEIPLIGDIYIPQNGDGLVGITYTPMPNGCGTPNTDFIEIIDDWDITITPVEPICPGAAPVDLSVLIQTAIPYPQGYTANYLPGTTVEIPAGTTIQVSCGDASVFCFVPVTNVATGLTINYNNFSSIPYAANTTVSFPNGAIVTYTTVNLAPIPTVYSTLSNSISGQLTSSDATAPRPSGTGATCNTLAGSYRYEIFTFQVSATGNYTFISNFGTADGYAYITQVPFTPGVCGSGIFVAKDDNSGPGNNPQFGIGGGNTGPTLSLTSGITYQLITTTVAQNAPANYSWAFSGAGNVLAATPVLGEWSGVGIIDELTGLFDPEEAGLGEHLITFTTYNGACINQDTVIVMVGDTTAPQITCPDDISTTTVSCSAFVNVPNATTSDNCPGNVSLSYVAEHPIYGTITSGTVTNINQASNIFPAGLTTITWTATDLAGNTATCVTEVLVIDSADPVIFCQQLPSVAGNTSHDMCGAEIEIVTPVAYDNCGLDSLYFVAIHTTDANGNPIDTDPALAGNQADTIYADGMAALIDGGSNTTDIASGIYPGGVTLIHWTVTDVSGRSASCTITVNVIDDDAPLFVYCPEIITSVIYRDSIEVYANGILDTTVYAPPTGLDFTDTCVAVVYWDLPLAIDNCSEGIDLELISILDAERDTLHSLEPILEAATEAALQADANSANAHFICDYNPTPYCVALLVTTEMDSTAAHNQLAAIVAAYNQAYIEFQQALANLQAAAADATINYASTHDSGDIFPLGDTPVTYTATDGAGNSANCIFIVRVEDRRPPEIFCPAETVFVAPALADACYGWIELPVPAVTDNCSVSDPMNSYNWGHIASDVYPIGTTIVTWTVTDGSGNTATCAYTVVIEDQTPPELTWCSNDLLVGNDPGECSRNISVAAPLAIDSCSNYFIVTNNYNDDTITVQNDHSTLSDQFIYDNFPVGITDLVWYVADTTGNVSTCTTRIRVEDRENPTITCPADITVTTDASTCTPNSNSANVVMPMPTATDNCGVLSITNNFNNTDNASGVYPVGITHVVWTVVDINGRSSTCTVNVTVIKCCLAEAGTIAVNDDICPGGNITTSIQGNNTTIGYQTLFLVTNASNGQIVAINGTGTFPTLGTGLAAGTYVMYAYNVKNTTTLPNPQPSVGMNIAQIGATFIGCYDLSNVGVAFVVPGAFPLTPIITTISEGSNGGISPFYYDITELTVYGGTQPYQFHWDNGGYVRYSISYELVDTNGDGTADTPGATITIFSADNAYWYVSVTDNFGCSANGVQFDNNPAGADALLDIVDYSITNDNGSGNGSINITPDGGSDGCMPYSYAWSGPNGFSATTQDLSNVAFGWYTVTVTCADGSQYTLGWYWVPRAHRGRSKTEGMTEGISVFPNPVQSEAVVEFYVNETGKVNVAVFAADGKQVAELFDDVAQANEVYELTFNAGNLPFGIYTVVMRTATGSLQHSKIIIAK